MPSHKRLTFADIAPPRAPTREVPVVVAHDHRPVESPARLLHAQLHAGISSPLIDVASQQTEPRYPGLIRLAIPLVGAATSWAGVALIIQLLR